MRVIAVCGMPGSGKEEFVKVAKMEGIEVVRMGDVVREEVLSRGYELDDSNVGMIADEERKENGMGIWAEKTVPLIRGEIVVIDGIRGDAEIEIFKRAFGDDMKVVCIETSPEIRYERIRKRKREDATMTWDAFCQRDKRELGWGIEKAMAQCNIIIKNESSLEDFQRKVRDLLETLK